MDTRDLITGVLLLGLSAVLGRFSVNAIDEFFATALPEILYSDVSFTIVGLLCLTSLLFVFRSYIKQ